MTLAIEPQLVMGLPITRVASDGWSVIATGISCHEEHTIFIHENGPEVITKWNL